MRKSVSYFFLGCFLSLSAQANFEKQWRFINFQKTHEDKALKALRLIKNVIESEEFKARVLAHSYQGQRTFVDNQGLSNADIYHKILHGKFEVEVELYHQSNTTIGYTYPDTKRIWVNKKYFEAYSPEQVADNLFHEWLHKIGFDHERTYSDQRNYSVPYALGYLMEELAAKIPSETSGARLVESGENLNFKSPP